LAEPEPAHEVQFSHFPNLHLNLQVQVHKVWFRFKPRCTRFMSRLVQIWVCTKFTSGSGSGSGSDLGSGSQLYYNSRKMTYLIIIGVGMGMVKHMVSHMGTGPGFCSVTPDHTTNLCPWFMVFSGVRLALSISFYGHFISFFVLPLSPILLPLSNGVT
jgi:hypothetical protein